MSTIKSSSANLTLNADGSGNDILFQSNASQVGSLTAEGVLTAATITASTAFVPDASGGADLGTTSLEFNDLFLNDSGSIKFGDDQEVTLTHVHNEGLTLKQTTTSDDTGLYFTLDNGETDIASGDVLGSLRFRASDESTGTDSTAVAAEILAISEGDFSSSNNETTLHFRTGASGAAADRMKITSDGRILSNANPFAWCNIGLDNVAAGNANPGGALNISTVTLQSAGVARFNYTNASSSNNTAAVTTHNTAGGTANWNNSTSSYIQFTYYHSNGSAESASGVNMVSFGGN